jgi:phosphate starvation-inducible protein PhoH
MIEKLEGVEGLGIVHMPPTSIVRHPIISKMLGRIEGQAN